MTPGERGCTYHTTVLTFRFPSRGGRWCTTHGNEERQRIDHLIRAVLGSQTVKVVEIAASDLDDPVILRYHLMTIAQKLGENDIVRAFEDE